MDPQYSLAKSNLAIAHNNYALYLYQHHQDREALKEFHSGIAVNPDATTESNMNEFLKLIGRDPENFFDRVTLGDESMSANDLNGAIIEYKAALKLRNSKALHMKLGHVYQLQHEQKKAAQEFNLAKDAGD